MWTPSRNLNFAGKGDVVCPPKPGWDGVGTIRERGCYWASQIVPVLKGDGSVRISGDYVQTAYNAGQVDTSCTLSLECHPAICYINPGPFRHTGESAIIPVELVEEGFPDLFTDISSGVDDTSMHSITPSVTPSPSPNTQNIRPIQLFGEDEPGPSYYSPPTPSFYPTPTPTHIQLWPTPDFQVRSLAVNLQQISTKYLGRTGMDMVEDSLSTCTCMCTVVCLPKYCLQVTMTLSCWLFLRR